MTSERRTDRRPALLLCVLGLLLAPARPAAAGGFALADWTRNESDWKSCGIGTATHVRTTRIMDIPGMPAGQRVVFEERRTLVAKDATTATIRVERKTDKRDWERTDGVEKLTGGSPGRAQPLLDDEERPIVGVVRIDGTDYACTKYQGTRTVGGAKERAVLWVHDVEGVLKYEGGDGAGSAVRVTWTVTKLRVTRTVGAVSLACRQLRISGKDLAGTMVVSPEVPGGVVEERLNLSSGATTTRNVRELIGFVKK